MKEVKPKKNERSVCERLCVSITFVNKNRTPLQAMNSQKLQAIEGDNAKTVYS